MKVAAPRRPRAYDREVELAVDGTELTGLEDATATKGERIEFKLANSTGASLTFEVLDPADNEVAEVDVPAGGEGEAIVELAQTGDWTLKVEGGAADIEQTLTVG